MTLPLRGHQCHLRPIEGEEIATRFFSPPEVSAIAAVPPARRRARFYALWTLKEAYVKARGVGLSLPLDRVCFRIEGKQVHAEFQEGLDDDAARWGFVLLWPTRRHVLAVSVADGVRTPRLRLHRTLLEVGAAGDLVIRRIRTRSYRSEPIGRSRRGPPSE